MIAQSKEWFADQLTAMASAVPKLMPLRTTSVRMFTLPISALPGPAYTSAGILRCGLLEIQVSAFIGVHRRLQVPDG